MTKENKKMNKVYYSFIEFEKEFFPNSYKNKIKREQRKQGSFGSELASEFLENVKRQLTKQ